jgi:hypothetical protein
MSPKEKRLLKALRTSAHKKCRMDKKVPPTTGPVGWSAKERDTIPPAVLESKGYQEKCSDTPKDTPNLSAPVPRKLNPVLNPRRITLDCIRKMEAHEPKLNLPTKIHRRLTSLLQTMTKPIQRTAMAHTLLANTLTFVT